MLRLCVDQVATVAVVATVVTGTAVVAVTTGVTMTGRPQKKKLCTVATQP